MIYGLFKIWVRLALPFFCRQIHWHRREALAEKGPLLLAVNHPNSFLDAVLLGVFFNEPVHFIARGDVFGKPWVRKLLNQLHMIPIYRIRDGKEKLSLNEETFLRSVEVLRNKGILLIFVEGFCEHQTTLQLPLKKGAPRILQSCWMQGIDVRVLPVWLQYSSFDRIGKTIDIRLGEVFGPSLFQPVSDANCIPAINAETASRLQQLCQNQSFAHTSSGVLHRTLLFIPAMLGAVLHAPLYLPVQAMVRHFTRHNVHYDSILLAILLFLYPMVLMVLAATLFTVSGEWIWWPLVILGLPALAWCFIRWKA